MALFRRRRLPAGARPPLDRDERVLAWAGAPNDAVVVVTNFGLWLPGISGSARLGWHEIHKATWSGRALLVVPARVKEAFDGYAEMVWLGAGRKLEPTQRYPVLALDGCEKACAVRWLAERGIVPEGRYVLPRSAA